MPDVIDPGPQRARQTVVAIESRETGRKRSFMAQEMYRHGDLLIVQRAALPGGAQRAASQGDARPGVVLAYGEVTGHAHRIEAPEVVLWDAGQQRYVTLDRPAVLDHEEHGPIALDAGIYEVIRQRTYTPEEVRLVAD